MITIKTTVTEKERKGEFTWRVRSSNMTEPSAMQHHPCEYFWIKKGRKKEVFLRDELIETKDRGQFGMDRLTTFIVDTPEH